MADFSEREVANCKDGPGQHAEAPCTVKDGTDHRRLYIRHRWDDVELVAYPEKETSWNTSLLGSC